jgi:hypothetical protein
VKAAVCEESQMCRMSREIIGRWTAELIQQRGISTERLEKHHDLGAGDFSNNEEVEIIFHDGSIMHFRGAFFVTNISCNQVAVFTEHCGYYEFALSDVIVQRIFRETFRRDSEELS